MNKKTFWILTCLVILAINTASAAQSDTLTASSKNYKTKEWRQNLKKGTLTLALNGVVTSHNYNYPNSNWFLTPQVGYLVADRLVVGFQLAASMYLSKPKAVISSLGSLQDLQVYSLAPEIYGRYYFFSSRFTPFVQLSSGYGFQWGSKNDADTFNSSLRSQDLVLSGSIGLSALINKSIRVEALYNHRFISGSQFTYPSNIQRFRLGVSVSIR